MMDFSNIKELTIDGVKLKELSIGGVKVWQSGRLPAGYTKVKYIRADKNVQAYIDLGFAFDTRARVETSMYFESDINCYPFGAAENNGALRCMISAPYGKAVYIYGSNGSEYVSSGNNSPAYLLGKFNDIVATWEKGNLYIENLTNIKSATTTTQTEYTMTSNLYLFAQNYNGSPRFQATGDAVRQIKYFKYYDKNDNLICDLIPCVRNSDGVAGMYDMITKTFFTSIGSDPFVAGPSVDEDYVQLEYIETAGTQYIDIGITGHDGLSAEFTFNPIKVVDADSSTIIGCTNSSSQRMYVTVNKTPIPNFYWEIGAGGYTVNTGTMHSVNTKYHVNISWTKARSSLSVEGFGNAAINLENSFTFDDNGSNMFVFARNKGTSTDKYSYARLYDMKIWDDGILVRDFIPALFENGQVGLYDLVTKSNYHNAGTGTFIAGPVLG